MKIQTSNLTDKALDWAVTKLIVDAELAAGNPVKQWVQDDIAAGRSHNAYSTDWIWGGPIIQKEFIELLTTSRGNDELWEAVGRGFGEDSPTACGPTPLVAAMRCYVLLKLGATVDIPKRLL